MPIGRCAPACKPSRRMSGGELAAAAEGPSRQLPSSLHVDRAPPASEACHLHFQRLAAEAAPANKRWSTSPRASYEGRSPAAAGLLLCRSACEMLGEGRRGARFQHATASLGAVPWAATGRLTALAPPSRAAMALAAPMKVVGGASRRRAAGPPAAASRRCDCPSASPAGRSTCLAHTLRTALRCCHCTIAGHRHVAVGPRRCGADGR